MAANQNRILCAESGSARIWCGRQDGGSVLYLLTHSRHLFTQMVQKRPRIFQVHLLEIFYILSTYLPDKKLTFIHAEFLKIFFFDRIKI
jgi:hypothetical protein